MGVSIFDSATHGALFGDSWVTNLFSDENEIRYLLMVEAALARVQGRLGIIPSDAAAAIDKGALAFEPDIQRLGQGARHTGVAIIDLVAQLREAVGGAHADFVHRGATSQDIVDCALVMRLAVAVEEFDQRLARIIGILRELAQAHRRTLMLARTRTQAAVPMTFGLKVAYWLAPLVRHRRRLAQLIPRALVVQLGGAAGTQAAFARQGADLSRRLAGELSLGEPVCPWHTQRDGLQDLANWLTLVTTALGKIGQDVLLLTQSEVAEVHESADPGHGGSSTMPQKSNPVLSDALVSAARFNAGQLGTMAQSGIQAHERDAAGWQMEWMLLPQMCAATGGALNNALALLAGLQVDSRRMRENLRKQEPAVLAEAFVFALAEHMPLVAARAAVREALHAARRDSGDARELLRDRFPRIDWESLTEARNYLGSSDALIERILTWAARNGDER